MSKIKPYRIVWRSDYTTRFQVIREVDTWDEAHEQANDFRKDNGGQTRIITQHVIDESKLERRKT